MNFRLLRINTSTKSLLYLVKIMKKKKLLEKGSITLVSLTSMLCERFAELPRIKLVVDFDDVWSDIVTHYKEKN